jgi:hypothetical protein
MNRFRRVIQYLGIALVIGAIIQEMTKPASQRTWNGMLLGVVPYDFRRPTLARITSTFWNPDNRNILGPALYGVGWTVNFHAAVDYLRQALGAV